MNNDFNDFNIGKERSNLQIKAQGAREASWEAEQPFRVADPLAASDRFAAPPEQLSDCRFRYIKRYGKLIKSSGEILAASLAESFMGFQG